jgi:very-short-patch-repair endonuclease
VTGHPALPRSPCPAGELAAVHRMWCCAAGTSMDLVVLRGLPVIGLPLTVLDAAAALGSDSGQPLVDRALQSRVAFAELQPRTADRLAGMGRPGWARCCGRPRTGPAHRPSGLHRLLRRASITGWVANHKVMAAGAEYWLDVAVVRRRLAIEVDGWAWHSDVDRFATDRRRQNALVLAGWTVLRFTWNDLTCRPEAVIAQIRATLRG